MIFDLLTRPTASISTSTQLSQAMTSGSYSDSGVNINADSAMKVSAVYACVMVISETIAQLPLILYEKKGDRKSRAVSHSLYGLLHDLPNNFQTSFDWRLTMTAHCLLYGAGYSFINRSASGRVLELLPIHPEKIEITQNKDYSLTILFKDSGGSVIEFRPDQLLRVTGYSDNGVNGQSVIDRHRQSIGIAASADIQTALTFRNGAKMSGILESDSHFSSNEVAARVKESWDSSTNGANSSKTALLEDGLKWRFIESRKFQIEDIARIFRVPPHKIGHLESATFSNIEHQGLEFVTDTLMPWIRRFEQSIYRDLLNERERTSYYAELLVDGLLRGDSAARAAFYQTAIGGPWMTINEGRSMENRDPLPGGDELIMPLNLQKGNDNA